MREIDMTSRENPKCLVRAVANEGSEPDGLEMRFTDAPPDDVRERLKDAGWVFAPAPENRYWFKRGATKADYALARELGGDTEGSMASPSPGTTRPGNSNALKAGLALGAATLTRILLNQ